MNSFCRLLYKNAFYFTAFTAGMIMAAIIFCSTGKISCLIQLNGFHAKWLNIFFIGLTFLGDGLFSLLAAAFILFICRLNRLFLHVITSFLFSGIMAQVLKHLFRAPRPKEIIDSKLYTSFFDGIMGGGWDSFPSGHSTSVFALATILALHVNKKGWGLFFLMMAALVGYSRIYLGQHFLQDIVAGALLGTASAITVYTCVNLPRRPFKRKLTGHTTSAEGATQVIQHFEINQVIQ